MDNIATNSASLTITQWKVVAEIFQSFGIGLGAVLGGLGGLILFLDWKSKKTRSDYLRNLRTKYPRSLLGKDFRVAHTHERRGWWFILDERSKTRHWIINLETMSFIGYSSADGVEVSMEEFNKYPQGYEIRID